MAYRDRPDVFPPLNEELMSSSSEYSLALLVGGCIGRDLNLFSREVLEDEDMTRPLVPSNLSAFDKCCSCKASCPECVLQENLEFLPIMAIRECP